MTKTQVIIVVRHGEKIKVHETELLTPRGERQITDTVQKMKKAFDDMDRIMYSGEVRTLQCAAIGCSVFEFPTDQVIKSDYLHFQTPYYSHYQGDSSRFKNDMKKIMETGNTVANARKLCKYAKIAGDFLHSGLLFIANEMSEAGQSVALCFSHSPHASLAVTDASAENTPYDINVADAVSYTISDGIIIASNYLPCTYLG
jgi:broad specificity phosphatase PhoE